MNNPEEQFIHELLRDNLGAGENAKAMVIEDDGETRWIVPKDELPETWEGISCIITQTYLHEQENESSPKAPRDVEQFKRTRNITR